MEERTPKCSNCRFYKEYSGRVGHCKRYPPTVYACDEENSTNVQSPLVSEDDWCGEFSPNGWVYNGQLLKTEPGQVITWRPDE